METDVEPSSKSVLAKSSPSLAHSLHIALNEDCLATKAGVISQKNSMIAKAVSLAASAAFFSLLSAAAVEACMICVPFPKATLADMLLECESIVIVREYNERPYIFRPIDVLKGDFEGDEIEAFVDSASRRKLKLHPEDVAVLVSNNPEGEWSYRSYANPEYQEFIRAILEQSTRWDGLEKSDRRVAFFTERLTADHPLIREQAYLEVGRAPYAVIKTIAGAVPRDQILELLGNFRLVEWHSLFILMLGQSQLAGDHDLIRSKFETNARFGLRTNLSAWATAYVEANPETGIDDIETIYFARDDRTREEIEEAQKSLSVLGSEGGAIAAPRVAARRRRIVKSYGVLLEHHPIMAGKVAKDLTNWRSQALADQLSGIMNSETVLDPESKLAVSYYLSMASRFPAIK